MRAPLRASCCPILAHVSRGGEREKKPLQGFRHRRHNPEKTTGCTNTHFGRSRTRLAANYNNHLSFLTADIAWKGAPDCLRLGILFAALTVSQWIPHHLSLDFSGWDMCVDEASDGQQKLFKLLAAGCVCLFGVIKALHFFNGLTHGSSPLRRRPGIRR